MVSSSATLRWALLSVPSSSSLSLSVLSWSAWRINFMQFVPITIDGLVLVEMGRPEVRCGFPKVSRAKNRKRKISVARMGDKPMPLIIHEMGRICHSCCIREGRSDLLMFLWSKKFLSSYNEWM